MKVWQEILIGVLVIAALIFGVVFVANEVEKNREEATELYKRSDNFYSTESVIDSTLGPNEDTLEIMERPHVQLTTVIQDSLVFQLPPEEIFQCDGCGKDFGEYTGIQLDFNGRRETIRYCEECFTRALKWAVEKSKEEGK